MWNIQCTGNCAARVIHFCSFFSFPPTDTHVVTVSATDLDGDEINFQIAVGTEGFRDFKVEETTGRVLVKSNGTLDREKQARYSVTVNAYDIIEPPRQPRDYVSVTFDVSIGDINDEPPRFLSPVTNLSVGEVSQPSHVCQLYIT